MKIQIRLIFVLLILGTAFNLSAQRQIEILDRGVVAVQIGANEVFVSWRWLGTESDEVSFNVYRGGVKVNQSPITGSTNYVDNTSSAGTYTVAAIIDGVEQAQSEAANVWDNNYLELDLNRPTGGTTQDGVSYTYSPNDCSVGDLDGDGQYEIIVKWDPSNSKDNSHSGYTGNVLIDAYKLDGSQLWRLDLGKNIRAGAHYTQFMVYDLDGDGKAEIACKTAPGAKDNSDNYLSSGPAATADHSADYRNSNGYILTGPEYLTVFSGETGNELATVNYEVARGSVSSWGDSYGNRVDRLMACVAYLDGEKPSLVTTRGIYTRMTLTAWDWDGTNLTKRWLFDSNSSGNGGYASQGNHALSVADVDDDGKDEIIMGSCTIDDDGTGLYTTGLGHGDALHVSDMDPNREGLEVFMPHENKIEGMTYRDAKTGDILWQYKANVDVGRGVAGDIDPDHFGYEIWSSTGDGMYNLDGEVIGGKTSMNFLSYWDGDLTRELLDNVTISKYGEGSVFTAYGCSSNNSTKATPNLSADILGDWREELILRTTDNENIRIYTTTDVTENKFITLMHDPQYRLAIAWQNVGYNQPPHLSYFLGEGMSEPPLAPITQAKLKWTGSSDFNWDINNSVNWKLADNNTSIYTDGDDVLFSMSGNNSTDILISETLNPSKVSVNSPSDYTFSGTGKLSGSMDLIKASAGSLTINTNNDYSGNTIVTTGTLLMNGDLSNSKTVVKSKGVITGEGSLAGLDLEKGGTLIAGDNNSSGTTTIIGDLNIEEGAYVKMDLSDDPTGVSNASDLITVNGNLNISGSTVFEMSKINTTLADGTYTLITFTGSLNGSLDDVTIEGINGFVYSLELSGNSVVLVNSVPRESTDVVWDGESTNIWNLLKNTNWLNNSVSDIFVVGDNVTFNDEGNQEVVVEDEVPIGSMTVDITQPYTFSGEGSISGDGGLTKSGSGYLVMNNENTFTGDVEIQGGFVEVNSINNIGQASSLGAGNTNSSSIVLNGGGIFYAGTSSTTNRKVTIGSINGEFYIDEGNSLALEGEISGTGVLTKRGTGTLKLDANNSLTGAVNLVEGTISLTSEEANSYGLGTDKVLIKNAVLQMLNNTGTYSNIYWNMEVPSGYTGTLNLDGRCDHYGSLEGGGTLNLNTEFTRSHLNGDWSAFTGQINVNTSDEGWFICGNSAGYGNAAIYLGNDVFALYKSSTDEVIEIGELSGSSSSVLGAGGQGSNTITWQIGGKNTSSEFNGKITDDQYKNSGATTSIIKIGSGRWTLTNSNTYTGGTIINGGTIIAANTIGSATGIGSVTINRNAALQGTGVISGEVYVNSRAYIMPGLSDERGTLTIDDDVNFLSGGRYYVKVYADTETCDKVVANGDINVDGTLYLALKSGTYSVGQEFQIFDSSNILGSFETISPASPGDGLYWDLSQLNTNGIVAVSSTPTSISSEKENVIKLYPNPVKDELYISLPKDIGEVVIEIRDVQGILVYRSSGIQSSYKIDVSGLNQGIYIVKVISGKQYWVNKILKKYDYEL